MNKQDLYKLLKNKTSINEDDYNTQYSIFLKEMTDRGIAEDQVEKYAMGRMQAYYKKMLSSRAIMFEGIVLGVSGVTDYGSQKKYDKVMTQYTEADSEMKDMMARTKQVRIDGDKVIPMHGSEAPDFKKGKDMIPANDRQRSAIVLVKEEGQENPTPGFLTLRGAQTELEVPLYQITNFAATKNTNKSTEELFILNSGVGTTFQTVEGAELIPFKAMTEMFQKYFPKNCVSLGSLGEWHDDNANNYDRFCIIKGDNSRLTITDGDKNNIMEVYDESLGWESDPITVWLDNKDPEFEEGACDLFVIGQTRRHQETGVLSMNSFGVLVSDAFKKSVTVPKIEPEQIKSTTIAVPEMKEPEVKAATPITTGGW